VHCTPLLASIKRQLTNRIDLPRYNALMKERLRSLELSPELVQAYATTFIARWDRYPLQQVDGTYTQITQSLTLTHIFRHLTASHLGMPSLTVGAYMLSEHSQAQKLCFDADTPEKWVLLKKLASTLKTQSIPAYLETSRRGGHLWLFTPLLSGTAIRHFGQLLLASHNINPYSTDGKVRIELYPKQDELTDGPGSFVRLPLGVHELTQRVYPFITPEDAPLAASIRAQIALLARPQRVPEAFIQEISALQLELPAPPPVPTPKFKKRKARRGEPLSEALKHSISVFDFVSQYVALDIRNRGFCPFHDDQKKSFQVDVEHNYWHCYAGCKGQTLIDFWMLWRETHGQDGSFKATLVDLREMLLK
jgi:hypothetical protein